MKLAHVQKKLAFETKGVTGRNAGRSRLVCTDKFQNVIGMRTVVKVVEQDSPFFNQLGEIRAIHKNQLFLLFSRTPNQHLLRDKNNYFAVKTHQVVNAGHEQITAHKTMLDDFAEEFGFKHGKLDRRQKDFKAAGQTVFIQRGQLKGYKGRIVYADEITATIQIYAKGNT